MHYFKTFFLLFVSNKNPYNVNCRNNKAILQKKNKLTVKISIYLKKTCCIYFEICTKQKFQKHKINKIFNSDGKSPNFQISLKNITSRDSIQIADWIFSRLNMPITINPVAVKNRKQSLVFKN